VSQEPLSRQVSNSVKALVRQSGAREVCGL
jgi:hypothetical protein